MEALKQENRVFHPPADFVKGAAVPGMDAYNKLCAEANTDYEGFWCFSIPFILLIINKI